MIPTAAKENTLELNVLGLLGEAVQESFPSTKGHTTNSVGGPKKHEKI